MSSTLRFKNIESAQHKSPVSVDLPEERPVEYFEKYVFTKDVMRQYLTEEAFARMCDVIDNGALMDPQLADEIAEGMKRWAMALGATHYTHWFQPLTEGTAEKHDAFVEYDAEGRLIESFKGKLLTQQEPDASSFPSGGMRSTFEARGYSAWDPTSPVFIIEDTLMIPTVFISYTGESLDYKAPLKRSLHALDIAATRVCRLFYDDVTRVRVNLGWEQEYFLVDESMYNARPDLVMTGRTLMGHDSAKNQQMNDYYFGAIPERVANFMKDLEIQALQLGIPCKTRHNEVAPNQYELAPIYEECNLAIDHNMLLMLLMKKTARRHGLHCLLHEKPFNNINGSGKHNNWSMMTDTGIQLFAPGKTENDNLRFTVFIAETLKALYDHNGLLKAGIMSAGNALRLGAHEAPPAIISAFLGKAVTEMLEGATMAGQKRLKLGIPSIPDILLDNTDRNRTSPFAFTGNRFEFRAVGSASNPASAMIVLNSAVADSLTAFCDRVEDLIRGGKSKTQAILSVLKEDIAYSKPICFNGNGYSDEWKKEAQQRGLDCESSCPVIYDNYLKDKSVEMFARQHVMTRHELAARNEIKWETYAYKVLIEGQAFGYLCRNHIIPVVTKYETELLNNVRAMRDVFGEEEAREKCAPTLKLINRMAANINFISREVEKLIEIRKATAKIEDVRQRAVTAHDELIPVMDAIRDCVDKMETFVDDELWPLPKYRELLFINE